MTSERPGRFRWSLVVIASFLMGAAGAYQFLWSSIRGPLGRHLGANEPTLGTVFTLFVITLTVSQFPAGWVRDRYGPRLPLIVGAVLLGAGFAGTAAATTPMGLAVAYGFGGIGAGIAYTVAVNTPVKWFDDRRGLATGVVVMAFGGLSVLLIPSVRSGMTTDLEGTLVALGVGAGIVGVIAALALRDPPAGNSERSTQAAEESATTTPRSGSRWHETVRTWQFWLLYAVFIVVNGIGVMVIGKAVAFAEALEFSAAVATGSASLIALADAGGVLVGSAASDRFGREPTAGAALALTGLALGGAVAVGAVGRGLWFVGLIGVAAFFRSPAFAIFPVLVGEYYGEAHSSTNYAALYTAKIWGAVLGGAVASTVVVWLGWVPTFLAGAMVATGAGLATFLLRPP